MKIDLENQFISRKITRERLETLDRILNYYYIFLRKEKKEEEEEGLQEPEKIVHVTRAKKLKIIRIKSCFLS